MEYRTKVNGKWTEWKQWVIMEHYEAHPKELVANPYIESVEWR